MNVLSSVILAVQMLAALGMIGLILIQHGKGADMGASFGGGSSGSLFGVSGSANFLSRTTAVLATVFFVATLALAYLSNSRPVSSGSVLESAPVSAPAPAQTIPVPGAPAATTGDAATPAPAAPAAGAEGAAQIPTK
ncbi:preprotein translocase subunit SecG [Comamonas testosteroni]|uniref:Protein-export membrane protein SecG n=1 Tax=Comamonas testosteroni TaxID=285 RepID=A0A373FLN0_COMTE|nr:preprotein translocase subunit SecG [Comamonas testosteroni]RGE45038.1 preprotein translocase subunit SecG [Comamonas testosteroni]